MTALLYPQARLNIIAALKSLADPANQQRAWIGHEMPELGKSASFGDVVNWLFDDTGLNDGVETCIGYMLHDQAEALQIAHIMQEIDQILNKYGKNLSDKDYIGKPEWRKLVEDSQLCLRLFQENDGNPSGTPR